MAETSKTQTSPNAKQRPLIAARERGGWGNCPHAAHYGETSYPARSPPPPPSTARLLPSTVGPGPGRYALPSTLGSVNHDPTKITNPSYRFGMRLNNASEYGQRMTHQLSESGRCSTRSARGSAHLGVHRLQTYCAFNCRLPPSRIRVPKYRLKTAHTRPFTLRLPQFAISAAMELAV